MTNAGGVILVGSDGQRRALQAGTFIGIDPEFAKQLHGEPQPSQKVPVVIGNEPDPKIKTQSNSAHGKPSQYGGQKFTVPYSTFVWMIQPPNVPGGGMGAMSGMGDPTMGGMGGGMGAPGGAAPMPGGGPMMGAGGPMPGGPSPV